MSPACQQPPTDPALLPLITTGFYTAPPAAAEKKQSKHLKGHSAPTVRPCHIFGHSCRQELIAYLVIFGCVQAFLSSDNFHGIVVHSTAVPVM